MWRLVAIAAVGAAIGCADPRPREAACPSWQADVAAALAPCAGCHGGDAPAAGYDLSQYLGVLGGGSDDVANAIAGDAGSRLLAAIDPARVPAGDLDHGGQAALHALLSRWVTDCDLAYLDSTIHAPGVLDPASAGFHGAELAARGWDLALCAQCHGADFGGGPSGVACTTCHERGPDACDTCHALVPETGAHPAHVGPGSAELACATCHRVPEAWDDEGHIRRGGAGDPPPAEVVMTGLAELTLEPGDRAGPPVYEAGTCRNVYCHGDVLGAAGGAATRPAWASDPPGPAPCGSCHGAPPPSHADDRCEVCHPSGAAHLDGAIQIGLGLPDCSGCHGSADSPAPPRDLAGNVFTTALGVGAHQAHLRAPSGMSPPVPCAACHLVPTEVTSPGHIDSAGPAEVHAALGWNRTLGTCATAWCHGQAQPRWTVAGEAACGTCHGVPPATAPHDPGMGLATCGTCHPATINALGGFIPGGAHLDGDVDAP
ncbi:MAG: CxxxxCH/CxxCH domain-containing protein [Kofleriaceae bacterium]|nr:CxxxxCH/CxxCH domain-containing protein [Kofleriaceae bacterium]MCL4225527.1 CxxxxCH/CxxCH domain-containing protein [Myxococcales bacterium]